jgi:error-prone DNA polymerase
VEVNTSAFPYAELDVTSNFSFLRGASHPDELVNAAALMGYRAIGIADINSFAGVVRMHEAAEKVGLRFMVGVKLIFTDAPAVIAWPTDRAAYARLCRLLTVGKRRTEKGKCELALNDFLERSDGVHAAMVAPRRLDDSFDKHLQQFRSALHARSSLAIARLYDSPDDEARLNCSYNLPNPRALHHWRPTRCNIMCLNAGRSMMCWFASVKDAPSPKLAIASSPMLKPI